MKLAYCNQQGELFEHPTLAPLGSSGGELWEVLEEDLLPLPPGATLTALPGRWAVGMTPDGEARQADGWAVGALLPAGYLRLLVPAGIADDEKRLPLFGYTAVCFKDGQLMAAALKIDSGDRWAPAYFNLPELDSLIQKKKKQHPDNRLVEHLAHCAKEYQCFTAQNLFYQRWEAALPVSSRCNASCVGCISLQSSDCCPSPQARIDFTPSLEEMVELAVCHLEQGTEPMVSGGQGCEGDPLLEADLWAEAIREIRKRTARGKINLNTNGGDTKGLEKVVRAGLDAVRVGLVSLNPKLYAAYHRPSYDFANVLASLKLAAEGGAYTSINLLTFPGITDREGELACLIEAVKKTRLRQLQLRNLNIDPLVMEGFLPYVEGEALGFKEFLERLHNACPELEICGWSR